MNLASPWRAAGRAQVSVECHFGEWLQGRLGAQGPVVLVTMRCPALRLSAPGPAPAPFPAAALRRFAETLGIAPDFPGAAFDFPAGAGAGASTAALVALARAGGWKGAPETLAAACVALEGACDPLMFPAPDALLWASRRGLALRDLPPPPRCSALGGFWGPPQRTDPADEDFDDVAALVEDWAAAAEARDLPRLAALASASAEACSARRDPAGPAPELARELGALGWTRAHTGSARALVFAPGAIPRHGEAALREAGLRGALRFETGAA